MSQNISLGTISEFLEVPDCPTRSLLGDADPLARLGSGGSAWTNGLQGQPLRRAHVLVTVAGKLSVQLVDDRSEPAGQQDQQLEVIGIGLGLATLPAVMDNIVADYRVSCL